MKTKTAYRPKPQAEIIPQPDQPVAVGPVEPQPEPLLKAEAKTDTPTVEQTPAEPVESEATRRLKQQLADLARSQELNHQAAQMGPQRPVTREQLLEQWHREGMSAANLKFLTDNPELVDGWQLTVHA